MYGVSGQNIEEKSETFGPRTKGNEYFIFQHIMTIGMPHMGN